MKIIFKLNCSLFSGNLMARYISHHGPKGGSVCLLQTHTRTHTHTLPFRNNRRSVGHICAILKHQSKKSFTWCLGIVSGMKSASLVYNIMDKRPIKAMFIVDITEIMISCLRTLTHGQRYEEVHTSRNKANWRAFGSAAEKPPENCLCIVNEKEERHRMCTCVCALWFHVRPIGPFHQMPCININSCLQHIPVLFFKSWQARSHCNSAN